VTDDVIPGWDDADDIEPDEVEVPGSRPRVDHNKRPAQPMADGDILPEGWDRQPRTYRVNGVDTQLFDMEAFMEATGLRYGTIRQWERHGVLPKPLMRSPRKDKVAGHRLYSREYVEGVARILVEEKVSDTRRNVRKTDFAARVRELFERTGG
jgi:hypothetical protein